MSMVQISNGDDQAVIGEADVGRQGRFYFGVQDLVRHVGKPGAARSYFIDPGGGLLDVGVAGVGAFAKGVDDDDLDALEQREAGVGDGVHVGEIGGVADAISSGFHGAVKQGNALKFCSEDLDGVCAVEPVQLDAGAEFVLRVFGKGVGEDGFEDLRGGVVGIEGNFLCALEAERAKVVHAENMVGVGVGVEHGVDVVDAVLDGLGCGSRGRYR